MNMKMPRVKANSGRTHQTAKFLDNQLCSAIIKQMSKQSYDDNKIAEAKEKLACHIGDPGSAAHVDTQDDRAASQEKKKEAQADFIDETGKVLLTRMTAAGG